MTSEAAVACEVIGNFSHRSTHGRFTALRSLVPDDGGGSLLAPLLLTVAADAAAH